MTFTEARILSRPGRHIRREVWEDKWFILWRGVWWCQGAAYARPVLATDYAEADLLARDWTTMPAPLAACPIDAGTGSTGGDVPAPVGAPPGAPGGLDGGAGAGPRGGGGEGTPDVVIFIGPSPDASGIIVRFTGLVFEDILGDPRWPTPPNLNNSFRCPFASKGLWKKTFKSGKFEDRSDLFPRIVNAYWEIEVTRNILGRFNVSMTGLEIAGAGGFTTLGAAVTGGAAITNAIEADGSFYIGGGTASPG